MLASVDIAIADTGLGIAVLASADGLTGTDGDLPERGAAAAAERSGVPTRGTAARVDVATARVGPVSEQKMTELSALPSATTMGCRTLVAPGLIATRRLGFTGPRSELGSSGGREDGPAAPRSKLAMYSKG